MKKLQRCEWCGDDPVYVDYHDREWGVPVWDDRELFEKLILDGAQAGLSWITILKRRDGYRRAFDNFDAGRIARYDARKVAALMQAAGIIRNRLKIQAAIGNARAYLEIREKRGSFADYLWQFVDGRPLQNKWTVFSSLPASTRESDMMSRQLKKDGFKFCGSTICYAFMQAVGMVNDHITTCFRYREIVKLPAGKQGGRNG